MGLSPRITVSWRATTYFKVYTAKFETDASFLWDLNFAIDDPAGPLAS